ncbi:unnamed protein product [Lactuca saligna]|uniref:Disease resistance protein RGA3 n=1 Tax=Lactuca saligna TaxID=75948 RepID=A0AA35VY92_LACSI|nr:unnamed protein product [Lactuca saligna]
MADALVTVAAEAILKKVASIAANEIALAWGYKEKLYTLEGTLKMIRAKLQDAENQKRQKHSVMEWLKQLKDVVAEADDVVDEVHYEMLRREVKKRDRVAIKVPSLPSLKKLFFRSEMGHKIKSINEKLSQINKQANELGLQNEQPGPVVEYRPYPETDPNLGEFKVAGRGDDEERIIHLLTESRKEEKLTIVPIVGMGGMGKTTLAKSVYNNQKIQQHFDVKAWLCVSVKVDIKTLLAKIYESLAREKPKSDTMANLVQDLEEKLGSKRYFLVLDDVWDEERLYWEDFRRVMINVKSQIGSSILVTTRKLDIGTKAMSMDSCSLKGLSDDDCWNIFKERAFLVGQSPQPELEEIGRDIVKKCCGLPLLLNVKHLAFYQEENEDDELKAKVSMFIERNTMARTLHTFFIKGEVEEKFSFQRLKCIRILKLNGGSIEKLDDSIGGLVHLRYLDLSYTEIHVLPESIGKLYHLQTLKLQGFRHLKKLPKAMRNLISLRYFMCDEDIPTYVLGQLIYLRKLSSVKVVGRKGQGIEELRHLNNLTGSLCISNLENVRSKEDAVKADLSRKKNLYNIEFSWSEEYQGSNRVDKDVLEGLQPPRDVKKLTFSNFSGDNFAEWVMKMAIDIEGKWTPLDKLVSIRLYDCRSCLSLPTLEHLPHLRHLWLQNMDSLTCLRSSDVTRSTKAPLSPSLRLLQLFSMKRLEKWIEGAPNSSKMVSPVLEKLFIINCPKIILLDECHPHPLVSLSISECTGLEYIKSIQGLTSLENLHIQSCPSLLGIPNFPNECHSLKTLSISHCNNLTSLPHEMFYCFAFLNKLELGPFSNELDSFLSLQGIEKLRYHLRSLTLYGVDKWESIPEEIQHLTSLSWLQIDGFGMRELPMWLASMSSIRQLMFNECKGLNKETVRRGAPQEATVVRLNAEKC